MGGDHLWEAIGAIGQIIGAVAVVVSIVYLSIQIRANTRATRGSASYDAAHSWAQTNEQLLQLPDQMLLATNKWFADAPDSLSEVEYARISILMRAIYQKLEGQYFLYKYGLLDSALWEQRRIIGRGMIDGPNKRAWWESEVGFGTFSHEFVREIEGAPTIDMSLINRRPGT